MSTAARDIFHVFNKMRGEKGLTTAVGGKKRQSFGLKSIVVLFILFLPIVHMWVWVCVHESRCQWRQKEEAGCSNAGATGSCGVDVGAGS